jgi:hypothetical protein
MILNFLTLQMALNPVVGLSVLACLDFMATTALPYAIGGVLNVAISAVCFPTFRGALAARSLGMVLGGFVFAPVCAFIYAVYRIIFNVDVAMSSSQLDTSSKLAILASYSVVVLVATLVWHAPANISIAGRDEPSKDGMPVPGARLPYAAYLVLLALSPIIPGVAVVYIYNSLLREQEKTQK